MHKTASRARWLAGCLTLAVALAGLCAVGALWWRRHSPGCLAGPEGMQICATSDLLKLPGHGRVPDEGPDYDLDRGVVLRAVRGETVAFQIVFVHRGEPVPTRLSIEGLEGLHPRRFLALYLWVDPGGYEWGTPSEVLPWPDWYPDALVPFERQCPKAHTLVESFPVPGEHGHNRAVWIDVFVPDDTAPGTYTGEVVIQAGGDEIRAPITVEVLDLRLPARPTIDAVAELYDTYAQEGVEGGMADPAWTAMAHCYQQLAHAHRLTFLDRFNGWVGPDPHNPEPDPEAWTGYDDAFDPVLTGKLFTEASGYVGPGQGVPPTIWRTPWPQPWSGSAAPLSADDLAAYEARAHTWRDHVRARNWSDTRWFAYLYDEVDGETDTNADAADPALWHDEMRAMQRALDAGAAPDRLDLIWTSHADARKWVGTSDDLVGTLRLWSPNAGAADPGFYAERVAAGDRVWFYHDGHPHIGIHSVNAAGWEMATWGLVAARYGLSGTFLWAANLGDPDDPYIKPSYKSADDRFGNGMLVYPGGMLDRAPRISLPRSPGPIPSIRLKNWRRGLQDGELAKIAGEPGARLLDAHVPRALGAARRGESPTWPRDPESWHRFRRALLDAAVPH